MEWAVLGAEPLFVFLLHKREGVGCDEGVAQALPYILHRHGCGVDEIVGVEAVVPQFVDYYLVGGEVRHLLWEVLLQLFDSHEQHGFAELVLMHAVALVADGTDGEHPVFVPIAAYDRSPCSHYLFDRQPPACELGFGELVAVRYDCPVAVIDIGCAEGDEHDVSLRQGLVELREGLHAAAQNLLAVRSGERPVVGHRVVQPLMLHELDAHVAGERLHDAQGVVEHTCQVALGVQAVLLHFGTYLVREARTDKQNAAVWGELPGAFGNLYFSEKLHNRLTPTSCS